MFTCIMPVYNEPESAVSLVGVIRDTKGIDEIICVDSCSANNTPDLIKQKYPDIVLIKMTKNIGKAEAVFKGTARASNENILLMDADLLNLKPEEVEKAITEFQRDKSIGMILLKNRGPNKLLDAIFNNVFLTGKRILKKPDLLEVQKENPSGYQLEVAINDYMIKKGKKVYWIDNTAINPHKVQKVGFIEGLVQDLRMLVSLISFIGIRKYLQQSLFFCREEIK